MVERKRRKIVKPTKEELQAALDELNRTNAAYGYTPTLTQRVFRDSTARYKLLTGPNRGGKTGHIAWEVAACAQRIHPLRSVHSTTGVYLVLAPSLEQIADPWGKKLLKKSELEGDYKNFPFIPECEIRSIEYSKGSSSKAVRHIYMKNGHEILFMPSGDENVWKRLEGKQLLGVALDESSGNIQLMQEILMRLLDTNSDQKIVEEAGGAWMYWGATDTKFNEAFVWMMERCNDEKQKDWAAFWIDPSENPAIQQEEREKLRDIIGEEQAAIRLDGTGTSLGLITIYGEQWSDEKHISESEIPILPEDNLWVSYDPGVAHPTGILCGSISPRNERQLRVHRFYNHKRKTVEFDLQCIADWLQGRWLEGFILDPAAKKTDKGGDSVASQITRGLDKFGIKVRRGIQYGYNRHEPGIAQTRRHLVAGNVLVDKQGEGCELFCYQMRKYRGRPETNFTGPQGVVKKEDEGPDVLRYWISKHPAWVERPPNIIDYRKPNPTLKEMVSAPELVPEDISPDQAEHLARLRLSAQHMAKHNPRKQGGFGRGVLPF